MAARPVHYDDHLHKALVASKLVYMKPVQKLVSFDADQSIVSAFEALHMHQIQSAPVFDKHKNAWVGIIDLKDFVVYILELRKNPSASLNRVADLIGLSLGDQWLPVSADANVFQVFRRFYRTKFHRLPVTDEHDANKVLRMVSQSNLLAFLAEKCGELGSTMKRSVHELDLGTKIGFVYCVMPHSKVFEVFSLLALQGVWGCAVIDQHSRLLGNISVSDLKFVISTEHGKLTLLDMTVGELLDKCTAVRNAPLTCHATDSLETVVKALAKAKVHRVYVVNENTQPQGVITLTDIIDCVARAADSRLND